MVNEKHAPLCSKCDVISERNDNSSLQQSNTQDI